MQLYAYSRVKISVFLVFQKRFYLISNRLCLILFTFLNFWSFRFFLFFFLLCFFFTFFSFLIFFFDYASLCSSSFLQLFITTFIYLCFFISRILSNSAQHLKNMRFVLALQLIIATKFPVLVRKQAF